MGEFTLVLLLCKLMRGSKTQMGKPFMQLMSSELYIGLFYTAVNPFYFLFLDIHTLSVTILCIKSIARRISKASPFFWWFSLQYTSVNFSSKFICIPLINNQKCFYTHYTIIKCVRQHIFLCYIDISHCQVYY